MNKWERLWLSAAILYLTVAVLIIVLAVIFSPRREYIRFYNDSSAPTCRSEFNTDGSLKLMICTDHGPVPLTGGSLTPNTHYTWTINDEAREFTTTSPVVLCRDTIHESMSENVLRCDERGAIIPTEKFR